MVFLMMFHDFIFGLGIVTTHLTYHCLKGMVHLNYKLYLKAVILCVKFNGAIGSSDEHLFLT